MHMHENYTARNNFKKYIIVPQALVSYTDNFFLVQNVIQGTALGIGNPSLQVSHR